jgi:hypothetical protein
MTLRPILTEPSDAAFFCALTAPDTTAIVKLAATTALRILPVMLNLQ